MDKQWKVVPVEPTEEMIASARGGAAMDQAMTTLFRRGLLLSWQAMLAAAPQPPSASCERILFPAHLRKMWSGNEVQAWLDEMMGTTTVRPTAKGSLERYRQWQAEQAAPSPAASAIEHERDRLRAEQAAAVMPLIGPLLDAWDFAQNDVKASITADGIGQHLAAISFAMTTDRAADPHPPSRDCMCDDCKPSFEPDQGWWVVEAESLARRLQHAASLFGHGEDQLAALLAHLRTQPGQGGKSA